MFISSSEADHHGAPDGETQVGQGRPSRRIIPDIAVSNQFATTQWKVVLDARDGTESQARVALESLCHAYWFPLYAYVRRRGHDADQARDLTEIVAPRLVRLGLRLQF